MERSDRKGYERKETLMKDAKNEKTKSCTPPLKKPFSLTAFQCAILA